MNTLLMVADRLNYKEYLIYVSTRPEPGLSGLTAQPGGAGQVFFSFPTSLRMLNSSIHLLCVCEYVCRST